MRRDNDLGDFLRARRHLTAPEQVGLPPLSDRRRTPGLRREEVATLAGVSTDYYIRLEQGRERHPSDQVLDSLARVLQLGPEAAEYLHGLARPRAGPCTDSASGRVDPNVVRLMERWDRVAAYVVNQRLDVLARNAVAEGLYGGLEHNGNLLRLALLNPRAREFYRDWEKDTCCKVAHLRAAVGIGPDDPERAALVQELSERSADFRRMWARHDVRSRGRDPVRFHHHTAGDLFTTMEVMTIDETSCQKLVTFQAEPGSPSEHALACLGATAAARRPSYCC
ncbi:helix-turn-helix transcriptional regulator [Sphaerisporangium rubeum]|uniref:Transcriptional regulator with XRE-family HTH domain n=1 Tax=Sphaerisporangium rubeum TaxID=321317 RepID=A0A7X0ID24_9ACTN|nr:helix-turn-helix transcriptional regulator [Sphaerisporangium rubeum]MBB6473017.1 transcriptional regulator with XRE-family HTH domain [Sphaerisporangium rubeum]